MSYSKKFKLIQHKMDDIEDALKNDFVTHPVYGRNGKHALDFLQDLKDTFWSRPKISEKELDIYEARVKTAFRGIVKSEKDSAEFSDGDNFYALRQTFDIYFAALNLPRTSEKYLPDIFKKARAYILDQSGCRVCPLIQQYQINDAADYIEDKVLEKRNALQRDPEFTSDPVVAENFQADLDAINYGAKYLKTATNEMQDMKLNAEVMTLYGYAIWALNCMTQKIGAFPDERSFLTMQIGYAMRKHAQYAYTVDMPRVS